MKVMKHEAKMRSSKRYFLGILTLAGTIYLAIVNLVPPPFRLHPPASDFIPDQCLPSLLLEGLSVPNISTYPRNLTFLEESFPDVSNGTWEPEMCNQTQKLAVIIPFRNRSEQLPIFLYHLHKFLQQQQRSYQLFIIEQSDSNSFNRGALFNVGFKEAQKMANFSCFILHDVDLLPENDELIYTCKPGHVGHFAELISNMNYTRIYDQCAGGVASFASDDFVKINGYSNAYWGWGAEDDDLYKRIIYYGLEFEHQSDENGRYTALRHDHQVLNEHRFRILNGARRRFRKDGLNSVVYELVKTEVTQLFIHISVDLSDLRKLVRRTWQV